MHIVRARHTDAKGIAGKSGAGRWMHVELLAADGLASCHTSHGEGQAVPSWHNMQYEKCDAAFV